MNGLGNRPARWYHRRVAGSLTIKQRRFLRSYIETGNGTQAALVAYDVADPNTAHSIATETLRSPTVQKALAALLDGEGLSDRKLREIHAHYLALYQSPDPREKTLGLKALDLAYKLIGAYAPQRHEVDLVFRDWTAAELQTFAETGEWPQRLRS